MRTIFFSIWIMLAAAVLSVQSFATGKPVAELAAIIRQLGNTDNYSYELVISSVMKDKPAKKEMEQYINYSSRGQFISYSGSQQAVIFINRDGMFKIDKQHKLAYYTQFNDSSRQQWQSLAEQGSADLADSVLLRDATVISKTGKNIALYKLKYAPQSMMKEMTVVYNSTSGSVDKISYTIERPLAGSLDANAIVRQTVTMSHYQQKMPLVVRELLLQTKDIYGYLKQAYPGYTIQKI